MAVKICAILIMGQENAPEQQPCRDNLTGLLLYPKKEARICQGNQSAHARILDAPALQKADTVRSTRAKRTNATRSTTETLLYAVDTAEYGNE